MRVGGPVNAIEVRQTDPVRSHRERECGFQVFQLRHDFVQIWDTDEAGISEAVTVYTRKDGSEVGIPVTTILRKRGDLVEDVRIYMDLAPLFAASAPEAEQQPASAAAR